MEFSVVIPSKNEEQHIGELLCSIREQTIQPQKLIVADKSTDATREIARAYGATIAEGQDDGKVGKARNTGAQLVQEEIIIFLDADTKLRLATFFEDILIYVSALDLDIATCYYHPTQATFVSRIIYACMNMGKRLDSLLKMGFALGGAVIIIKKDVFTSVGRFREDVKLAEDVLLVREVIKNNYRYGMIPLSIDISSRRFSNVSCRSLISSIVGGIGSLIAIYINIPWFKRNYDRFQKWYGETGGSLSKKNDE